MLIYKVKEHTVLFLVPIHTVTKNIYSILYSSTMNYLRCQLAVFTWLFNDACTTMMTLPGDFILSM